MQFGSIAPASCRTKMEVVGPIQHDTAPETIGRVAKARGSDTECVSIG